VLIIVAYKKDRVDISKNGYWQNELHSLEIGEPKQKKNLDDNKEELKTYYQTLSNRQCFRMLKCHIAKKARHPHIKKDRNRQLLLK
jgi:hypothetical protein